MATKSLNNERNERLRGLVRSLLSEAGGNQSELARRMKIKGSQISELVSEKKGAGLSLLDALHDFTGKSYDELITGKSALRGPAQSELADTPAARARAAAVALGFSEPAIEAEIAKADDDDRAWTILLKIEMADSKAKARAAKAAADAGIVDNFDEAMGRIGAEKRRKGTK